MKTLVVIILILSFCHAEAVTPILFNGYTYIGLTKEEAVIAIHKMDSLKYYKTCIQIYEDAVEEQLIVMNEQERMIESIRKETNRQISSERRRTYAYVSGLVAVIVGLLIWK